MFRYSARGGSNYHLRQEGDSREKICKEIDKEVTVHKTAFDKIAEGLSQALSIARGLAKPAEFRIPTGNASRSHARTRLPGRHFRKKCGVGCKVS
jgi:hypothetical protein